MAFAAPAFAHHPGIGGNTGAASAINTISATTLERGQTSAGIFFELIGFDAFSDAELAGFTSKHIHAHSIDEILSPSLGLAYGLTSDLTIGIRLPYVTRNNVREGHHHHDHDTGGVENTAEALGDADGIGDVTALAHYRFLNNAASGTELALLAGFKAPTGKTSSTTREGERFEAEFQPGTGSWDGLIGLAVTQRLGRLAFDANILYVAVSEGTQNTDLGDRLQYNAALSYRLTGSDAAAARMNAGAHHHDAASPPHSHGENRAPSGPQLDAILELNGEWHDRQDIAGETDANSGGNGLYLSPGARLTLDNWSAFASVGIPVAVNLYGTQSEPDCRLTTGIAMQF